MSGILPPRNCRHCTWMTCGDANWCSEREATMSDLEIKVWRKCDRWNWNPIDALTLEEWHRSEPSGARAVLDGQTSLEV